MRLADFLSEKRSVLLDKWLDATVNTYPQDTAKFLKSQKDEFRNPVGHTLEASLCGVFDEMLSVLEGSFSAEKFGPHLDNIIRIRAVQDFRPSEAVSFLFLLKDIVRKEAESSEVEPEGLSQIDSVVDRIVLLAFDIYSSCRERLFEVKTNELRRLTFRLLERANKILGEKEPSAEDIRLSAEG